VAWVSGTAIAGAVADLTFLTLNETGWLWPPPPLPDITTIKPQEAVMVRYRRALDTWLDESKVEAGIRGLLALADQHGAPDLIMTDPFLSASAIAAEVLGIPMVVCGWPALRELDETLLYPVQKVLADDSRQRVDRLCQTFSVTGENFSGGSTPSILSPHLHLSYFCDTWYQADAHNLLAQNEFVGGQPDAAVTPDWLAAIPMDIPLAVITLGTTFTGDLGFYAWAAQAAARCGLLPIVAIGNNPIAPDAKQSLLKALPRGTRLVNYVPFDAVLPRAKIMIHHGGMGSTHRAVVHGVPQIVVPHAADQRGQARRASQALVGLNLTAHDVRHGKLLEGTRALLADAQVQQTARDLATEMASLGGAASAANAIEDILGG
jgi:MGT family glycosyltransferase